MPLHKGQRTWDPFALAKVPVIDRFMAKVSVEAETGCWIWLATKTALGYGCFKFPGRQSPMKAHRFAYLHFIGPIPEGTELDHLCRRPACVNPAHLEAISHAENMRRGIGKANVTHCPNGHPYVVGERGKGAYHCRVCYIARYQRNNPALRAYKAAWARQKRQRLREP